VVGGLACAALAWRVAVEDPGATAVATTWLALGVGLYATRLAGRAERRDAWAEAADPELAALRGRSALILVPIANPAYAQALTDVAHAITPPAGGRVLLLSIVRPEASEDDTHPSAGEVVRTQQVLGAALGTALAAGRRPEALITVADDVWPEIERVAAEHGCEGLVLGHPDLAEVSRREQVERLVSRLGRDVVILRAPPDWAVAGAERVLIPVRGHAGHDELRARLLGSLLRAGTKRVTFVQVVPIHTPDGARDRAMKDLLAYAADAAPGAGEAEILASDNPLEALIERTKEADLIVLGMQRIDRRRRAFGPLAVALAEAGDRPTLTISRRG
jgi:hypothetical protein